MFDITPSEIAELSDIDLRELVGRLCEAELASRGLSLATVTWGGQQTSADGGLDVRVTLPKDTAIDGFIPRPATGFQVKKPDMPRSAILSEMRPGSAIRPVIQELADEAGSYVILSANGSTADTALRNRRNALREAVKGIRNADQLHTDFYDRTRLATWVRRHPGLITWVKEKIGRALAGWRPYGAWCGAAESVEAEYLLDEGLRLLFGDRRDALSQSMPGAIDQLRDELGQTGRVVRLVGLSGVGKTRLAQALFDARIGSRPLPPSLAVYANLSDSLDPQPTGLASDLIANRRRAVVIVDNCPPDLHRRLTELCTAPGSTVSVLTIEYDVRDDQPEGTQVVTLETSSIELIQKLIARRYRHLSGVDGHTIAEASGGNARIAIAIASTVKPSETIAGLSDDDLFQRLFRQRHAQDNALLAAAQACSLIYSFEGEALAGESAELPRLAVLADQQPREIYRHVKELFRRNLVQQRGVWRAVLPHAVANRLAARALDDTPYEFIDQQLISGGTARLARSFSRRLSFLHDHHQAIFIVERWLAPTGWIGDIANLNDLGRTIFENVAPVSPEATLAALERADSGDPNSAATVWRRYQALLRSLAYDAALFERSALLLARAATQGGNDREIKEASDTFVSLFWITLSGTHATIAQRLAMIEELLRSGEHKLRSLGLAALDQALKTAHFNPHHRFEFGARSRDYGYRPKTNEEVAYWYHAALNLLERLAFDHDAPQTELRSLFARNFQGLWAVVQLASRLEDLTRRFAASGFWYDGWIACRQTLRFGKDQLSPESKSQLTALEAELRPSDLSSRVRAIVIGRAGHPGSEIIGFKGDIVREIERLDSAARELGRVVAQDDAVFTDLLPDLVGGGTRVRLFGQGLASACRDRHATWVKIIESLERIPADKRDVQILIGFLAELWDVDRELAQTLLDLVLNQPALATFLPALQSAVQIDARGRERLVQSIHSGKVPVWMYRYLAWQSHNLAASDLKGLLLLIAEQPNGFDVALEILDMRLHSDASAMQPYESALLEAGRELLRRVEFRKGDQQSDCHLADLARACLKSAEGAPVAAEVARRLRDAVARYDAHAFEHYDLLRALMTTQFATTLDALFEGSEQDQKSGIGIFRYVHDFRTNPIDEIPCDELIAWCERDREARYVLIAAIVTISTRNQETEAIAWSKQATALLASTPHPKNLLEIFIDRFRPMSWSGSRASLIEANAHLLDDLEPDLASNLALFLAEAKEKLLRDAADERRSETSKDRDRDERFE